MTGTIVKSKNYNARMKWPNQSVANAAWADNTGSEGVGVCPSGTGWTGYNLALDVPGTYLVTAYALFANASGGFRGLRIFKNNNSQGEGFTVPSGHYTWVTFSRIVESNGNDTVRMGLYQNSGATITVHDIFITAIYLGE